MIVVQELAVFLAGILAAAITMMDQVAVNTSLLQSHFQAAVASWLSAFRFMDQPTIRREKVSNTTAKWSHPSPVLICTMSASHFWLTP